MATLIILQCSGLKVSGGELLPINDTFADTLQPTRILIQKKNGLIINPNLFMPAYLRYGTNQMGNNGGRLYTHLNWNDTIQPSIDSGNVFIVIISALYGLIEYDTPILNYDLNITSSKRAWLQNNLLKTTLSDYINARPQITQVLSFLSSQYYSVLDDFHKIAPLNQAEYIGNKWIRYDRGANVATLLNNHFVET